MARDDALWAILSEPGHKHGRWTLPEFFATGRDFIDAEMRRAAELRHPERFQRALDFGCGVGRLARALAAHFDEVVGVDISTAMIETGRKLNAEIANLTLLVNDTDDLRAHDEASFDMVNAWIVLQHMPSRALIERYLREFLRVLRPGGLLHFGVPERIPLSVRLFSRRNPYVVLRALRVPQSFLYRRLGLHAMHMTSLPRADVERIVSSGGGTILAVDMHPLEGPTYFVTR
jgi:SAM-dependent methyltransferase